MLGDIDVLVLTALKEELDALLLVTEGVSASWTVDDADGVPVYRAVLDGGLGSIKVVATHQTKMAGSATAALAATLVERLKPACLAMCGVCAGHPTDTELGDVVLADRVFQHDEGKSRADGFQADLWVDSLREDWLRVAQGMVGPAKDLHGYQAPDDTIWKWWLLDTISTGRDPLKMATFQRFIPSERREERLTTLLDEDLVRLDGEILVLSEKGTREIQRRRVLVGGIASDRPTALPYHIHVGPMGSGNAVEASGTSWDRMAKGGERKVLAVEMEAAALGRVAHDRGLRLAVAKGVVDHANPWKRDGYKPFAARVAAEVLCRFLRAVVKPSGPAPGVTSRSSGGTAVRASDGPNAIGAVPTSIAAQAAEINRIFNAHLRDSGRRGCDDAMPSAPSNESDLATYYSLNEVDQRARRAFNNPGMLLVRDSQDWAAAWGLPLPPVVERRHLAAREVLGAAEMAILLLLRSPRLEVLGDRARLEVDLRGQHYGIYNNVGKEFLAANYLSDTTEVPLRHLGNSIHDALLSRHPREVPLTIEGEEIPYRWASGGILPIVRWQERWWCALFWRDIPPIGWNIANGASESEDEYLDLDRLIWREAREELVILARDPTRAGRTRVITRYLVTHEDVPPIGSRLVNHHRLRAEQDHWNLAYPDEREHRYAVKARTVPGPHSILIHDRQTRQIHDVLLSINPLEFGIEITRVVCFDLRPDDILVDGEVLEAPGTRPALIRRPVGLINLATLHHAWSARGSLGVVADGPDFLEGRKVRELSATDFHVFDADIRTRQSLNTPTVKRWDLKFGRQFEQLVRGGDVSDMLQTLCPVTWRVLELAFSHRMLGPDGPHDPSVKART